jgi:Tol biopolymer transport system component
VSVFAFVGRDRQVHLGDAAGSRVWALTGAVPGNDRPWGALAARRDAWSWPTWSPDGAWIACFAAEESDEDSGPARIVALSIDGVREEAWGHVETGVPVYVQWSPSGAHLAVLAQDGQELTLTLVSRARLGRVREVASGLPLFFNWTPEDTILLHVGQESGDTGLVLRDPVGTEADVPYPSSPGSFCAPVFAGGRPVYAVEGEEGASEVVTSRMDGGDSRTLARYVGLLAIVPAPRRPWVALSASQRGEGSPYDGIDLVQLYTGEVRRVSESACLAYFWAPDGSYLLQAIVDHPANGVTWWRVDVEGGPPRRLATFWPTRDTLFFLHFFDQYGQSHSPLSPDGRWLVYAGYPVGGTQADVSVPARIWVLDLEATGGEARPVAEGTFATFPPPPSERGIPAPGLAAPEPEESPVGTILDDDVC